MTDTDIPETHDGTTVHPDSVLTPYRGKAVIAAGITINNASGGLQEALNVDPVELDLGDTVYVVLECAVRPPQYDPIDKDNLRGPLKLVNRLHAIDATFVDGDLVKQHLDAKRLRIEEAEGTLQLPFEDGDGKGGEPQTVGQVLDDALDLADAAEQDSEWREQRVSELDGKGKPELLEIAATLDIPRRTSLTKTELVDAIVDTELAGGGA